MRQNPTHTSSLRKAGKRGIRERGEQERQQRGQGGGEKSRNRRTWSRGCSTHTWAGRAPSARAVLQAEDRGGPLRCAQCWELRCGLSTHAATLSAHGLLAGAQSTRSDSQGPRIHQACSFCDTFESFPKVPLHTHARTHIHVHTHAHTYTHILTYTHTHIHAHAHTCTHILIYIYIYTHRDIYTCVHTCVRIHTHIHIYTHRHSLYPDRSLASLAPMSSKDSLTISGTDLRDPDPAFKRFNWL